MIHASVNGLPDDTYVCWDYYPSLNPYGFCQWRGLFRQGPDAYQKFNQEVQDMIWNGETLEQLNWNSDLAKAAANYL